MVDVVPVLLWPLQHLATWQDLGSGSCPTLALRLGVVQLVQVRLWSPPGVPETAQDVLGICLGAST